MTDPVAAAVTLSIRRSAVLAICLVSGFLLALLTLHILEPEFDPSWHWISEYELGRHGWLMSLAFGLWGAGTVALLTALRPFPRTGAGRIGRIWLLLMAVALFGAGVFRTDPITATHQTVAGILHSACGMFTVLTFPIMATVLSRGLLQDPAWAPARRQLRWWTALTWLAEVSFWSSIVVSIAVNHPPTAFDPQVLAGWPNRVMATSYALWLIAVGWHLARTPLAPPVDPPDAPVGAMSLR